jgi:hypothetical protein
MLIIGLSEGLQNDYLSRTGQSGDTYNTSGGTSGRFSRQSGGIKAVDFQAPFSPAVQKFERGDFA